MPGHAALGSDRHTVLLTAMLEPSPGVVPTMEVGLRWTRVTSWTSRGSGVAPEDWVAVQAALGKGLSKATPCATPDTICGSGIEAIMLGRDRIAEGSAEVVIAGGMGSTSSTPYALDKPRAGQRLGHMLLDGLDDAYDRGRLTRKKNLENRGAGYWSGRRESNPHIQLGKP